jgi:hypothetical protein
MPANAGIQVRLLFGFHHSRVLKQKAPVSVKSRAGA